MKLIKNKDDFNQLIDDTFDTVKEHLLKQKDTSMITLDGSETCAYRGEDGLKCAVGCLISDEYYKESFEGCSPDYWPLMEAIQKSMGVQIAFKRATCHRKLQRLLLALQYIHDVVLIENWEIELNAIEDKLDLFKFT